MANHNTFFHGRTPLEVMAQGDFVSLYETFKRLEASKLNWIPTEEIPFGIPGCSYAVAPFTHVNLDGSRFSDGSFGVLYVGDTIDTALAEVRHHQETY